VTAALAPTDRGQCHLHGDTFGQQRSKAVRSGRSGEKEWGMNQGCEMQPCLGPMAWGHGKMGQRGREAPGSYE